jgi:2-dehydro-3-deoxyphosphogluconate aldolase/(4S)-4-hydroxy-2-oxoglutarate aldolase
MKYRSRQEINKLLWEHALLPLFNPDDLDVCKRVVKAAYEGGVRLFECTNRSANALAIFRQLVPFVEETMPDLALGAGTILNETAARQFHEAGAQFIVSPVIAEEVGTYCRRHDLFWCPGAATLTEILHAQHLGADVVKIFPANFVGGPGFVKAIKAPCPDIRVMPTGGVDGSEENLRAWFDAGVVAVGIGSQLFTAELLSSGHYDLLTTKTRSIVDHIKTLRLRL